MRLVPMGSDTFEVQHHSRKIGAVWRFKGRWHGETVGGTAVPSYLTEGQSKEDVGLEVEKLHQSGL